MGQNSSTLVLLAVGLIFLGWHGATAETVASETVVLCDNTTTSDQSPLESFTSDTRLQIAIVTAFFLAFAVGAKKS